MSEYVDAGYEQTDYAYDDAGNVVVEHTEVDAQAYDFDGDGHADYVEASAETEVYAQDSAGDVVVAGEYDEYSEY